MFLRLELYASSTTSLATGRESEGAAPVVHSGCRRSHSSGTRSGCTRDNSPQPALRELLSRLRDWGPRLRIVIVLRRWRRNGAGYAWMVLFLPLEPMALLGPARARSPSPRSSSHLTARWRRLAL